MTYVFVQDPNDSTKKKRGLVLDNCQWEKLQGIVTHTQRLADQAAQQANYLQGRKDLSAKMQSEWDNTYVNMRKKRFEEMEAKKAMVDAEREKKYWQLRREEQEAREKVKAKSRKVMAMEKDCCKTINRAFLLAESLRERNAQVKFSDSVKKKEIEKEIEFAKGINEDVKKYHQEEFDKFQIGGAKREKFKQECAQLLKEAQEEKLKEELKKKAEGKEELIRMGKEIKEHEEKELKERIAQREICIDNILGNLKMKEFQKKKAQMMEEEEDAAIRIIGEAKKRLHNERKQRDRAIQEASVEKRNQIARAVAATTANDEQIENDRIAKARAENEARLDEREKRDLERIQMNKIDTLKSQEKYLRDTEMKKRDEFEAFKWDMLQRFKKDELFKSQDNRCLIRDRELTKETRIIWNKQIKERKAKEQKEMQDDCDALNRALQVWEEEDKDFFEYTNEMLEDSKKVGRPTYPIEAVLEHYKKQIGALPKRPLSATWKSNVPINNPAVEEVAERRKQTAKPQIIRPKCSCMPRNGMD